MKYPAAERALAAANAGVERRRLNDLVLLATLQKYRDEAVMLAAVRHWRKTRDDIDAGRTHDA